MSETARQQLAFAQAQLVRALVEGAPAPADFDRERLEVAAESLLLKRARTVAHAWPQLARAMGDLFAAHFASYARVSAIPHDGGPLVDGRAFIDWLERAGFLTDEGRLEAFAFDARYQVRRATIEKRRGPVLRFLRLKASGRLVVVIRLPMVGERWLNFKIL